MGRAVIWGLVGLVASVALHCPLMITTVITVVTAVVGTTDWHMGEAIVAAGAAAAAVMFFLHPRGNLLPLAIWAAVPVAATAVLVAWMVITRPRREEQMRQALRGRPRQALHGGPRRVPVAGPAGHGEVVPLRCDDDGGLAQVIPLRSRQGRR